MNLDTPSIISKDLENRVIADTTTRGYANTNGVLNMQMVRNCEKLTEIRGGELLELNTFLEAHNELPPAVRDVLLEKVQHLEKELVELEQGKERYYEWLLDYMNIVEKKKGGLPYE